MSRLKRYQLKKGCLVFREKICFKTKIHEIVWKNAMRIKGFKITEE